MWCTASIGVLLILFMEVRWNNKNLLGLWNQIMKWWWGKVLMPEMEVILHHNLYPSIGTIKESMWYLENWFKNIGVVDRCCSFLSPMSFHKCKKYDESIKISQVSSWMTKTTFIVMYVILLPRNPIGCLGYVTLSHIKRFQGLAMIKT